ncbi:MAG TPA: UvrD-helicase domain-containing protein, partial [Rickettsia endosymbiont of Diachasma alloeum]|nr:UvrD-helicase domain-containing protein [Rickettsia endosymbiont of Diachasma alloeum]
MQNHDFLHSLNEQQQKAVLHTEGPLLLLAGAGTGKTKVLTSRIANIIHQNLASPQNILAVTFTNKAAKEMQERVHNLVSSYGLNIGTFHSMAARILRDQIENLNLGLNSRFTIINQDDQLRLIKDIVKLKNIDTKKYAPKLIHIVISRWKDQGLLPNKLSSSDTNLLLQRVAKLVYEEYQQNLLISNVVDFGDLLLYNNELFIKNPEILKYYQEKYRYILIDEYQDTNVVQYLWARMLASLSKNICCVGDDDQSIYGWRGAEVGNILRFEKDFLNATIIKLEQNY